MVHKQPTKFYVVAIERTFISSESREDAIKLWSLLSSGKYKLIGSHRYYKHIEENRGSVKPYSYYGKILGEHDPYSQSGMSMYVKEDVIYDSKQEAQEARDADKAEEKLKEAASKIPVDK